MSNCPVCNKTNVEIWSVAKDFEYFTSDKSYTYFICLDCNCIFIAPIPFEELHQIYPPNYYSFVQKGNLVSSFKIWLDKQRFRKLLKQLNSPTIKVLDVGGGFGWLSTVIKQIDPRIKETQIIDINRQAGDLARANGHKYFEGKLEDFASETRYDLILMLNLIEHVKDPMRLLCIASALLNEDGIILIKTPNTVSLDARLFRKKYWGGLHCPRHWIIFSESGFRLMLRKTDLKIEQLEYTQGGPFWAFSIIISLFKKGWIKVSAERPVVFHSLYPVISTFGALFDFIRRPFSRTSQMFIVLKKQMKITHGRR
jgi:2-polyprenyl-3-methyl-5-hydroxy-6-metoxy-1,4-benzoquinol methylase